MQNSLEKIFSIGILFVVTLSNSFGYTLPKSATIHNRDVSGKTWRENATIDISFPMAERQIESSLYTSGYNIKDTIVIDERNNRKIIRCENGYKKIIVMIWRISDCKTGISWGFEK